MTIDHRPLTLNDTGYYKITAGGSLVYPITLDTNTWIKVNVAHTNFNKNQTWSMRFWISPTPVGESISGIPRSNLRWISPLRNAQYFGVYDITSPTVPTDSSLAWLVGISPETTYWINARNMENRDNGFYLTLDVASI